MKAKRASRSANHQMSYREWLLLALLSIVWGTSFFFMKTAVTDFTPYAIVTIRVGVGALVIAAVSTARGNRLPRSAAAWGEFAVMALLNNVIPFTLISWSMQFIDTSLGSILNATTPIFSVINVHLLTREDRLSANRVIGILLGWIGVATMIGLGALQHLGTHIGGQLAILGSSCSYSLAAIYGRRFRKYPPLATTTGMLSCATLLSLPATLLFGHLTDTDPSLPAIISVLLLGMLCTGTAYIIYYRILLSAGPTNVLLVTFLVPVTAILLGILALGETMEPGTILGGLLLFAGLVIIDGRVLGKVKRLRASSGQ